MEHLYHQDIPILDALEFQRRESLERTRIMLREAGRPDLVAELDQNIRDCESGVMGAKSTWRSISPAQRRVLVLLEPGRRLRRCGGSRTRYDAVGGNVEAEGNVCGIATARNLCARELIACDGTAFDPEARFTLTERGRFVLAKGR